MMRRFQMKTACWLTAATLAAGLAQAAPAVPEWTRQDSGVAARLRGVSAVSEQVAWASGSGNTVLRTADGGATWTRLALPPAMSATPLDYRDIDAIDMATEKPDVPA